jgi:flagellar motor switch protein FliM
MGSIGADLRRAFRSLVDMEPKLVKLENNFRLVNIVDADTEVLVSRFKVKTGTQAGLIQLIIPYPSLEPIRERFRDLVTISQSTSGWGNIFGQSALEMSAAVTARSGQLTMSVREVLELKVGDIVDLGYDPDQPLTVLVEDKPKFFGLPGERGGKQAVHITGLYSH